MARVLESPESTNGTKEMPRIQKQRSSPASPDHQGTAKNQPAPLPIRQTTTIESPVLSRFFGLIAFFHRHICRFSITIFSANFLILKHPIIPYPCPLQFVCFQYLIESTSQFDFARQVLSLKISHFLNDKVFKLPTK